MLLSTASSDEMIPGHRRADGAGGVCVDARRLVLLGRHNPRRPPNAAPRTLICASFLSVSSGAEPQVLIRSMHVSAQGWGNYMGQRGFQQVL